MQKLRVLQFQGLAPSVFCGLYFSDLGADVVIIARHTPYGISVPIDQNLLNRNKKCICLDLKSKIDIIIIKQLIKTTDIIIDPFRPGVLQKCGLGPNQLYKINPKIILLRVSGYGQTGQFSLRPGHDLNYLATAGILPMFGQQKKPQFPNNYAADFVSVSFGITGTLVALIQRERTNQGRVVDCSLADCSRYMALPLINYKQDKIIKMYKINGEQIAASFKNEQQKKQFEKNYIIPKNSSNITRVYEMKDLPLIKQPLNLMKQKYIMEAKNDFGYQITSPFTEKVLSRKIPMRGQHTQVYLRDRGIDEQLIRQTLKMKAKL